jgi:hypothetical protein
MDIVDRLKSSHSLLGDPLHRDAWEEIERLRDRVALLEGHLRGALWLVDRWTYADTTEAHKVLGVDDE